MEKTELYKPEHYENRELSWLKFNERILGEARDKENLLFERLKFLSITASNLDEFFMVRVASLKDMVHAEYEKKDIAGLSAKEQLAKINIVTHEMIDKQYSTYNRSLLPQLLANGLKDTFNINPLLLIPPIVVIGAIALKIPAIPGITLGLITGAAGAYLPEAVPVDVHPPQTHSGLPRPERGTVVDFPCADRHHPDRLYHAVNPVITFHCFSLLFTPSYKTRSNRHLRILYYQFTGLRRTFKPCPRFGPEQDKKIPRQAKLPDRRLLRFTSGSAQAELYGPVPRRASLRLISDPVPAEHQSPLPHIFHLFFAVLHTLSTGIKSVRSPTRNHPPPKTQYHYTVFPRAVTAPVSSSFCFAFCFLSFSLPISHEPVMYVPDAANRNLSYLLLSGYSRQYADAQVTAIPRHVSSCACTMTIPRRVYSCVR